VLVCVHCKHSLQPSGQTVSKHLWEKHSLPAKDRAGLNAFVRSLELQDPNALPPCPDGSPAHPHLAVQCGMTCLQCRYRTTSPTLLQRHMAIEHGQRKYPGGSDKGILWAEATLQSWSQQGKRDFWIVKTTREDGPLLVEQSPLSTGEEKVVADTQGGSGTPSSTPTLYGGRRQRGSVTLKQLDASHRLDQPVLRDEPVCFSRIVEASRGI
jgi:hypothetical protein